MPEVTCVHVWIFSFAPLICVSVFLQGPYCYNYYVSVINLEMWNGNSSSIALFAQDCWGYFEYFVVLYEFWGSFI